MKLQYHVAALALLLVAAVAQDEGDVLSPGLRKDREGLLALKSKVSSPGTSQIENWKASGENHAASERAERSQAVLCATLPLRAQGCGRP